MFGLTKEQLKAWENDLRQCLPDFLHRQKLKLMPQLCPPCRGINVIVHRHVEPGEIVPICHKCKSMYLEP